MLNGNLKAEGVSKPNETMTLKWNFWMGGGFNSKNLPWEGHGHFRQHIDNSMKFKLNVVTACLQM